MNRNFDVYISWCKGIETDEKALELISKDPNIAGIEISDWKNVELIQQRGVQVSIHNPLREIAYSLEDKQFKDKFTSEMANEINKSNPRTVGFHAGYLVYQHLANNEEVEERVLDTLTFLKKNISKEIIFETCIYESNNGASYVTNINFIKNIIKFGDVGYLFDISHNFISFWNKNPEIAHENMLKFIQEVKDSVREIHINVPKEINTEGSIVYKDRHQGFSQNQISQKILHYAKILIQECPHLELINLEMDPHISPVEHVQFMQQQVKTLLNYLEQTTE